MTPQKRALKRYRKRLVELGLARFEVLGRAADRDLIRSVARMLADEASDSAQTRTALRAIASRQQSTKGGILEALRRSPLVGADLKLKRAATPSRKVDM